MMVIKVDPEIKLYRLDCLGEYFYQQVNDNIYIIAREWFKYFK